MRREKYDLTTGKILNKLLMVALPIMGTSFMQMAYNLINMFWLGSIGSGAVAAAGTAGMFLWVSMSFIFLSRVGVDIGVSQNFGKGQIETAKSYAQTAFTFSIILGIIYMAVMLLFRAGLIGFFRIPDEEVSRTAQTYLMIVSAGIPFSFASAVITATFNASGNSRLPFVVNGVGIILNMILDPLLIFGFRLGINGAGIATVIAQIIVCTILLLAITIGAHRPFQSFRLLSKPELPLLKQILQWSIPVAMENLLFSFLSILINRMVAGFGVYAMAAMRVGSQIESLTWLIAGGYGTALTTFVGQNYGADKQKRIRDGMKLSFAALTVWGAFVTILMLLYGRMMVSIFLHEKEAIALGATYMIFLAVCQITGSLENAAASYLRGTGKTLPPSIVSITCNLIRVPIAYALSLTSLGLNGLWAGFIFGAILRGIILILVYFRRSRLDHHNYKLNEVVS